MGWKAFNLIATTGEGGYLATFPPPIPSKAREYLSLLGGSYESQDEATFENGLNPQDADELYVGAYYAAVVVGSVPITEEAFSGNVPRAVGCATALLPGCRVLVAMLHSVVDLFGYAWYENGRLLRARAGPGIMTSLGGDATSDFHAIGVAINDLTITRRRHRAAVYDFRRLATHTLSDAAAARLNRRRCTKSNLSAAVTAAARRSPPHPA